MSGVSLGYYYGFEFVQGDIPQLDHSYARPFQSLVHHNKNERVKPRVLLNQDSGSEDDDEVCANFSVLYQSLSPKMRQ